MTSSKPNTRVCRVDPWFSSSKSKRNVGNSWHRFLTLKHNSVWKITIYNTFNVCHYYHYHWEITHNVNSAHKTLCQRYRNNIQYYTAMKLQQQLVLAKTLMTLYYLMEQSVHLLLMVCVKHWSQFLRWKSAIWTLYSTDALYQLKYWPTVARITQTDHVSAKKHFQQLRRFIPLPA